jgi:hypothetical protein
MKAVDEHHEWSIAGDVLKAHNLSRADKARKN